MKQAKERVQKLLEKEPKYRDNDNLLIAEIWISEMNEIELGSTQVFLANFARGKFTSAESITRVRRKIQEHNEHLRGEKYNERHEVHEPNVRGEIRNWNNTIEIEEDGQSAIKF